ncbi:ABC transporter permease [Pseudaminobacter soli (ex Li et al. 2025)]|uniref:ABC transporter permease n=1 Tax=Pseudaminobacter soli (ex Li et al. 2025) TaxID=1295366 RepID=A0A2P7SJZ8_9HYPH|nr:ABC transporter permease [Mesorhizobium soli]PSJ62803.1 ABC transporter permease [Mesorhizobium soli]
MLRFLLRRLVLLVPVVLGTATLTFLLMHLSPGDPARTYLGEHATPEAIAALRQQWGLDQPLLIQYLHFLRDLVTGELGQSMFFHEPIADLLATRLPPTLLLMLMSALLSLIIAVPLAAWSAVRNSGLSDTLVRTFTAVFQGTPIFFVATVFIVLFGIRLKIFPVAGYGNTPWEHVVSLFLPSLALALGIVPVLMRSLRTALIDALNSEYVSFARAKGLLHRTVWLHYALRNASISGLSVLSIQVSYLAGGTLVVENVFAIPGMGTFLMKGILNRDFPIVQASALVFALLVILVYLLTDVAYKLLDPRVRLK